jgi:adenylate cyclase class 2
MILADVTAFRMHHVGAPMLEVEMKFPVADLPSLERRLADSGAVQDNTLDEADHYFNSPDRDFARTDEALRLRRTGASNFVTYKGPKLDTQTKTRTEVEVALAPGDATAQGFTTLLVYLGYRPVAVVRKRRRTFRLKRNEFELEITLDNVEKVGQYAELEIQAPQERLEDARKVLLETAAALGLTKSERRSYLELLLSQPSARPPS